MKEYIEPELDVLEIKSQNMLDQLSSLHDTQEDPDDEMLWLEEEFNIIMAGLAIQSRLFFHLTPPAPLLWR